MGFFSWMLADFKNTVPLKIGMSCYVSSPDGNFLFEPSYDGYGHFNGRDIYELVLEWNHSDVRKYLQKSTHTPLFNWPDQFLAAVEKDIRHADTIAQEVFNKNDWIKKEWKRTLGIDISCYDEQNQFLQYPIKIVLSTAIPYCLLPASTSDVNQGCDESDLFCIFSPGKIFSTPKAVNLFPTDFLINSLSRHLKGDWGEIENCTALENNRALNTRDQLFSEYHYKGKTLWIITDSGWKATTLLLPDEY